MIETRGGRHRKETRPPGPSRQSTDTTSAEVPAVFPPHPALVSGGWYARPAGELPGPGRYPVESRPDKPVGVAVLLAVALGPVGLCYLSVTAGLIAIGATLSALLAFGFVALLVVWPIAIAAAAIGARVRHQKG